MDDPIKIIAYPDYKAELTEEQKRNLERRRLENEKKYIENSPDKITLDTIRPILAKIDKAGLVGLASLCGGLCVEAFRRSYLKGITPPYLRSCDAIDIRSKDGDFHGERAFTDAFRELYPETEVEFINDGYPDDREGFAPPPFGKFRILPIRLDQVTFKGEKTLILDIIPRLSSLDEKDGYPYKLRQGICTVEKPFGEDGPSVNLLDPVSIMLSKAGVLRWGGLEDKIEKYRWHLRILALCIPPYLEEKTSQFKEGKLDRNPAVMARRLLNDMEDADMDKFVYYRAFADDRKALDIFKSTIARFAKTTQKEVYMPEDFALAGR